MAKETTYLDEDFFMQEFASIAKKNRNKDLLNDLEDVDEEILTFFKDLICARSTDDLKKYNTQLLDESWELLSKSKDLLTMLANMYENDTILGDFSRLKSAVSSRKVFSSHRRLL